MFRMKYLDGTPVDNEYAAAVSSMVAGAAAATEFCSEDELEAFADRQRQQASQASSEVGA